PRTIIVGLLVGVVVTVLASLVPAIKATRVPPVTALRDGATTAAPRINWKRITLGTVVTVIGLALLLLGLFAKQGNRLVNTASGSASSTSTARPSSCSRPTRWATTGRYAPRPPPAG